MVIVDSPGIGDSEGVNAIALEYLPQASAFIYVINSPNAGGLQDDRVSKQVFHPLNARSPDFKTLLTRKLTMFFFAFICHFRIF